MTNVFVSKNLSFLFVFLFLFPSAGDILAQGTQRSHLTHWGLKRAINKTIETADYANAFWGIQIVNLDKGKVVYERNAQKSLVPASNLKLYTTAAGLNQFGNDYKFETNVWLAGDVRNDTLFGDVIIQGSGDPTIGGRFNDGDRTATFRKWADDLKSAGVHYITGNIIGDDDIFDDIPLEGSWELGDLIWWYSAELGGLVFNDNCIDFEIVGTESGRPAELSWFPRTNYVDILDRSMTIDSTERIDEDYTRLEGTNNIIVASKVPAGQIEYEPITITNPTKYFVTVLTETLIMEGVQVNGTPLDIDDIDQKPDYTKLKLLTKHFSPTLSEIVYVINKESMNLYADQLLKSIGTTFTSESNPNQQGSFKNGVRASRMFFGEADMDTTIMEIVDGSGLSRHNFVTPEMTVKLLTHMSKQDTAIWNSYYNSLPIGGVDGSLENRFNFGGPAVNNVHAKTGFVGNVRTLSGYVTSAGGTRYAFSLMCNNYTIPTRKVNHTQDVIIDLLARFRR